MSLLTSLQMAKNSLLVAQLGLQVTGNNIANVHTPGYLRQELVQTPAPSQRRGHLILGLGVQAEKIKQQVDKFLEERLRGANSDLSSSETQEKVYLQLESLVGELSNSDISTALTSFFNSVSEVLNQPESRSIRNLVALQGDVLTKSVNRLQDRLRTLQGDLNDRVVSIADEINGILKGVARLNVQIVSAEAGGSKKSDAVGLRDRRQQLLSNLSKLTDIQVAEQPTGSVTVFTGGEFLVFENIARTVEAKPIKDSGGTTVEQIKIVETDSPLNSSSGELAGLAAARDEVIGGFLDQIDEFTRTLIFEFNKVYTSGQGLVGFDSLTSESFVSDVNAALDQAELSFTPVSGGFQVLVRNAQTGLTNTTNIAIDLHGLDTDTSLQSLATALDAIDGISAEVTPARKLQITSDSPNSEFAFANDSSGVLAALGLNTFFAGDSALTFSLHESIRDEPARFAASRGGIGEDTENAVVLAGLFDAPLESQNGGSLSLLYSRMVAETSQASAVSRSVAEGFRVFQKSLEGEELGITGVSLDEEAIRMITYQRVFQLSARFIGTVTDLLQSLVEL